MEHTFHCPDDRHARVGGHIFLFAMDARDILGIDPSAASASAPRPRASKPQIKKPEGMSREVFALLGNSAEASGAAQVR